MVRRFSILSFTAVGLLLASGVANSVYILPTWSSLFATVYGRLLLAKIAVALLMIGLGAVNALRLKPRVSRESSAAPALRTMAFTVMAEAAGAFAVMGIVGVLCTQSPGN
jgi:putative copper export protein